jgi:hypothetical protein
VIVLREIDDLTLRGIQINECVEDISIVLQELVEILALFLEEVACERFQQLATLVRLRFHMTDDLEHQRFQVGQFVAFIFVLELFILKLINNRAPAGNGDPALSNVRKRSGPFAEHRTNGAREADVGFAARIFE